MFKNTFLLIFLSILLTACSIRPPASSTIQPAMSKTPALIGTASSLPSSSPIKPSLTPTSVISTSTTYEVDELARILYASDPQLPQYDPQSTDYQKFSAALAELSAMGPNAIEAASAIAKAISYPRPEAKNAAQTLISLGPEITATTLSLLLDNLHSPLAKSRLYSLIAIGSVGENASCAVGSVGPLLMDPDPEVRFASASALQKITGKHLLPDNFQDVPDPLAADSFTADIPEGTYTQSARNWWTEEGTKINWHPSYGLCDA